MANKDASDKGGQNMLILIAKMFAGGFIEASPQLTKLAIDNIVKNMQEDSTSGWVNWCNKMVSQGWIDSDTATMLKDFENHPAFARVVLKELVKVWLTFNQYMNALSISSLDQQYEMMQKATPHPAPIENLVRSMMIDPARSMENRAEMKKHGFNDTQIDNIILSFYRLYDENTIRTCYLRGIISEELMYERMRELGYTDTRTKEIVQTWELLPSPQDLFTMVAHEAFEPDIYRLLGLESEFPTEQVQWLEKQGISESWARKFWISHWEQPSIQQGFEMLHRGVIDFDTLDMLFRTVEIPPYWRDKLTKIAYQPLTRVDVRRMHDLGVISDEGLIRSYLDLGYSPENAINMANFTIKYNTENEQNLTRSTILSTYKEGLITRADATSLLTEQGYSEDLADYYLTYADYQRDKEIQDLQFDNVKERYLLGLITIGQARTELNRLGILATKIESLLESWELDKYKYERLPTKSECDRFYTEGLIGQDEYVQLLTQHGFAFRYIQIYLKELTPGAAVEYKLPTKTDLNDWVKKGVITREQYRVEMTAMGYATKDIDRYLNEFDYDITQAEAQALEQLKAELANAGRKPSKSDLDDWLKKTLITPEQYRDEMHLLGFDTSAINLFINEFQYDRQEAARKAAEQLKRGTTPTVKVASKADLDDWVRKGIITKESYRARMSTLGYSDPDIDNYLAEYSYEIEQAEKKTAEAQKLAAIPRESLPSKTDLANWLKADIISKDKYITEMQTLGYNDYYINNYLKQLGYEVTT